MATSADPVGQRGAIQLDPYASVNLRLAIERKMISVFRDQYVGQQPWPGQSALDRSRWRWRFDDHVALRAAQLWTYVTDHLEAGRGVLQHLGDIFAQFAQLAATLRTAVLLR